MHLPAGPTRPSLAALDAFFEAAVAANRDRNLGKDYQVRWIDPERGGDAAGQISACQWLAPGIARVGNDRTRGWIIRETPTRRQLQLIDRYRGNVVLISGEPFLPATWLEKLSGDCRVILDGACRSRYMERISSGHSLIHATSRDGAYRKTW